MFRSRAGHECWHFCENCPAWPPTREYFNESPGPPVARWCRTCVRMYEAGTGELEWPADHEVLAALTEAWVAGRLRVPE